MENKNIVSQMRPKTYKVLDMAVEDGVRFGWCRAHKHTDKPSEVDIQNEIQRAVMNSICEWFNIDNEENF